MSIKFRSPMALKMARLFPKAVKRLHKEEDGATAVEFALIAFPFFLLIFAIIESSVFFFAGQYLETAVDDTMRLFRTGQLDQTTTNQDFRDALCDRITVMFNCDDIRTIVRVEQDFAEFNDNRLPVIDPVSGDLLDDRFDTPCPRCPMMVTASYKWPVITNYAAPLAFQNGNFALMSVVAVAQTEPY